MRRLVVCFNLFFLLVAVLFESLQHVYGHSASLRGLVDDVNDNDICSLPPDTGLCEAAFLPWYWDGEQCSTLTWGGCGGNENNFRSQKDCEDICGQERKRKACTLPGPIVGPCEALIERWYYDKASNSCQAFTYGGCDGNENNFETLEECESLCEVPQDDICELNPEVGPCDGDYPRWYYDKESRTCTKFSVVTGFSSTHRGSRASTSTTSA